MNLGSASWATLVACLFLVPSVAATEVRTTEASSVPRLVRVTDPGLGGIIEDGPTPEDLPLPPLPLPPTGLRARIDGAAVELAWEAPVDGPPVAYRIHRIDAANAHRGGATAAASPLDVWTPLQQVPGDTTTFRDEQVDLTRQHYVYVVTALRDGSAASPVPGEGASTRQSHGSESPPSDPAYTWNTFTHCSWFDLNLPHGSGEPEVHPDCILSNGTAYPRPPVFVGVET